MSKRGRHAREHERALGLTPGPVRDMPSGSGLEPGAPAKASSLLRKESGPSAAIRSAGASAAYKTNGRHGLAIQPREMTPTSGR
jgi:hypothetical protein